MGHKPTYTSVRVDQAPEWRQGNPQGPFIFAKNQPQIKGLTSQATASTSWVEVFGVWKLQMCQVPWKCQRKKQPLTVLSQIFRHHFSLDFPNTNNPSGNLVHTQTNYPILNPMQGTRNSAMRGSPCPQLAHSLSEKSGKIYHKLNHKSTEELGKTSWRRWHPLPIRRDGTGGALEPEAWWSGLQCLWSKTRKIMTICLKNWMVWKNIGSLMNRKLKDRLKKQKLWCSRGPREEVVQQPFLGQLLVAQPLPLHGHTYYTSLWLLTHPS